MNIKDITFTDIKTIKTKKFQSIAIFKRKKRHKYSKYPCMYFKGVELDTYEEYYFMGEETDVVKIENIECSIEQNFSGGITLYHKISGDRGFRVVHCADTLIIK
jgi:hypothetical protein